MKEIKCLVEFISEELDDAEKYAKLAMKHKDTDKRLGDMYATLAREEIGHSEALHEQAVRLIEGRKAEGHTAPESMKAVWEWEHEKAIDHKAKVKMILDMYRA